MRNPVLVFFAGIVGAVLLFGGGISFTEAAALPAPTSPSPRDGATAEQPVELKWSKVQFPVAGGYLIEISGGNLASSRVWSTTNSFTITQSLLVGTEHQWRVRACFGFDVPDPGQPEEDQCGSWSNNGSTWKFTPTLAKPKLLSPTDTLKTAISKPVTLEWEKVVGADKYNVILRKTSGTGFLHTFEGIAPTVFEIPSTWILLNNSYTWQVISLQGNRLGQISDLWEFFVALRKPTLLAPSDGDVRVLIPPDESAQVTFQWNEVDGAGLYRLEFFGDTDFPPIPLPGTNSGAIPFVTGTYQWQVTACETEFVNCGLTSDRWEFTVVRDTTPPQHSSVFGRTRCTRLGKRSNYFLERERRTRRFQFKRSASI